MRHFFLLLILCSSICLKGQEKASYFHDGEHHFIVNNVEVSGQAPSILLADGIMFEYYAKIYLVKGIDKVKGTGERLSASLVNDRTKLKRWGIDFYTKMEDSFVIYFNGEFRNPDQFFLGVDGIAYGYGDNSYFRLNKYETAAEGVFEEIFVFDDGIWWRDASGQLFGLRNGKSFQGDIYPFKKGYMAKDAETNEYVWLADYFGDYALNKVLTIERTPEAIAINLVDNRSSRNGYTFIGRPFYRGRPLHSSSIEREMDDDKTIYFFDPEKGKAFYGEVPDSGQTMEMMEIEVPESESKAYWISDNSGQTYLQIGDDIWLENLQEKGGDMISETDRSGSYYQHSGPKKLKPWVLYPAKVHQ